MSDQRNISDAINYRNVPVKVAVLPSALAIQNIAGTLCQVDDEGNVTPLIGGTIGGITALSGDVVATGPGAVTATIQPARVTYAKIQNVAANSFLGNNTGAPASVAEISPTAAKTMLGLAAIATTGSAADLTGTLPAGVFPALTGDVTTVAGSLATTLQIGATRIPFGDGSGHKTDSAGLTWSGTTLAIATTAVPTLKLAASNASGTTEASVQFFDRNNALGSAISSTVSSGGVRSMGFINFTTGHALDQITFGTATDNTIAAFPNTFDVILGSPSQMLTTTTTGFVYMPTVAGAPTGVPSFDNIAPAVSRRAMVIDDNDGRLYAYYGGAWHFTPFDDGASSGITQLAGDISAGPGTGIQTATIQPNVVTLAKMATMATNSLLGRSTAGTGNVEVITVGSGLTLSGGTLTSTSSGGTITALTGDVTASGSGSVAATIAAAAVTTSKIAALNITTALIAAAAVTTAKIANNAVTYALIQTQADQTILGNVSGGTAVPSALTKSQVLAMLAGGLSTGIVGVTATSGTLSSNALTNTEVMYATGANTIGQSANFTFASNILSVPTVSAVGAGQLTLQTTSSVIVLDTGGAQARLQGHWLPTVTATYNLGSASLAWATATVGTVQGPSASLQVQDSPTDNTHLNFNSAQIDVKGNLIPTTTGAFTLGSAAKAWSTVTASVIQGPSASLVLQDTPSANTQMSFLSSQISVTGDLVTSGAVRPSANVTYDLGDSSHYWVNIYGAHLNTLELRAPIGASPLAITDNAGSLAMLFTGGQIGFFGSSGAGIQTIAGSRGGNAALASLLTKLAAYGLIVDGSSP